MEVLIFIVLVYIALRLNKVVWLLDSIDSGTRRNWIILQDIARDLDKECTKTWGERR